MNHIPLILCLVAAAAGVSVMALAILHAAGSADRWMEEHPATDDPSRGEDLDVSYRCKLAEERR
jgi:hypothetical protein